MKKQTRTSQYYTHYRPGLEVRPAHAVPVKKSKNWPAVMTSMLLLLGGVGIYKFFIKSAPVKSTPPSSHAVQNNAPSEADITSMAGKINKVIADYPGVQISVSVADINTGSAYNYGISEGYIAASTAKLITAAVFLHEVESGDHSLDETVNGATANYELEQLIEQSDNDAWYAFNDLLGHPALESWAASIGLADYDADSNILTSNDIALLLLKLYKNKLLNPEHTKLLLSYMQNANESQFIPSSIPPGVKVYHKAGWLDDRVHDAAIIDDGKNPYVLVIFTKVDDTYDQDVGKEIFHNITSATTTAFIK